MAERRCFLVKPSNNIRLEAISFLPSVHHIRWPPRCCEQLVETEMEMEQDGV